MPSNTASFTEEGITASAPQNSNLRWFVCALLFAATTINYMDRSALGLIEPLLHVPFMGWVPGVLPEFQVAYHLNYAHIVECFMIAYGVGFLFAGRIIDKLGTKVGYACAIAVWACASLGHSIVTSVVGFCIARIFLGLSRYAIQMIDLGPGDNSTPAVDTGDNAPTQETVTEPITPLPGL